MQSPDVSDVGLADRLKALGHVSPGQRSAAFTSGLGIGVSLCVLVAVLLWLTQVMRTRVLPRSAASTPSAMAAVTAATAAATKQSEEMLDQQPTRRGLYGMARSTT